MKARYLLSKYAFEGFVRVFRVVYLDSFFFIKKVLQYFMILFQVKVTNL